MRKGISPLVATVLLIAATMSIAGILAFWSSSYVKSTLPNINETEQKCKFAEFAVYQCVYNSTTQEMKIVLENRRDVELSSLKLFVVYPDLSTTTFNFNESLGGNILKTYTVAGVAPKYSNILIKTNCPEASAESKC